MIPVHSMIHNSMKYNKNFLILIISLLLSFQVASFADSKQVCFSRYECISGEFLEQLVTKYKECNADWCNIHMQHIESEYLTRKLESDNITLLVVDYMSIPLFYNKTIDYGVLECEGCIFTLSGIHEDRLFVETDGMTQITVCKDEFDYFIDEGIMESFIFSGRTIYKEDWQTGRPVLTVLLDIP